MKVKNIALSLILTVLLGVIYLFGVYTGFKGFFPTENLKNLKQSLSLNSSVFNYDIEVEKELINEFGEPIAIGKENFNYTDDYTSKFIRLSETKGLDGISDYKYYRSLKSMYDDFLIANKKLEKDQDTVRIKKSIEEIFKITEKNIINVVEKEVISNDEFGKIEMVAVETDTDNIFQYIQSKPKEWNGKILIAIHGCSGSPDGVMSLVDEPTYLNSFGYEGFKEGYMVIAPYILNMCDWVGQFDSFGISTNHTAFGYEIEKILAITEFIKTENSSSDVYVYGISFGAQIALLSNLYFPFDATVISGSMVFDYHDWHLEYAREFGLTKEYRTSIFSRILSLEFDRVDIIKKILPRKIIIEFASGDIKKGLIEELKEIRDYSISNDQMDALELVFIDAYHETYPQEIFRRLKLCVE